MDAIKPVISTYLSTVGTVSSVAATTGGSQATTPTTSPLSNPAPADSVQFSPAAIEVAKYAGLARRLQDHVSPDKIAALKQAVATGTYPAPLVVDGLLELVGSSLSTSS